MGDHRNSSETYGHSSSRDRSDDRLDSKNQSKKESIPFSSNEYLAKIGIGERSVSVIGYVEEIDRPRKIKSKDLSKEFEVFKFMINNSEGTKIQCVTWNNDVEKIIEKIHLNEVLLIETVISKQTDFNDGNVPYELLIKSYSKITKLNTYKPQYGHIENIELKDVFSPSVIGYIRVNGYIRNEFVVTNERKPSQVFGAITDGTYKLEVIISNYNSELNLERGEKIELTGKMENTEISCYFHVDNTKNIKKINAPMMSLPELLAGIEKPNMKRKHDTVDRTVAKV